VSGLRAIVVLELRTLLRDRSTQIAVVVSLVGVGAVLPVAAVLPEPRRAEPSVGSDTPHDPEALVDIAVIGEWPADVAWPEPFVARSEATLEVVVLPPAEPGDAPILHLSRAEGVDNADVTAVERRLRREVQRASAARLDRHGIDVGEGGLVRVVDDTPPAPPLVKPSLFGSTIGMLALLLGGSFAIEAVPRRRASGLLEQLRSTATHERSLVAGWLLSNTLFSSAVLLLSALVYAVVAQFWADAPSYVLFLHAPPFALLAAAGTIATSLRAPDVQAATLRWFLFLFALGAGSAGSLVLLGMQQPMWAALVPLGGSAAAVAGALGPWAWLADAAAIGWAVGIGWGCAWALSREDAAAAGVDPELSRRASGNYRPEAAFLAASGLAGGLLGGGVAFSDHPWVGITFGFVGFMLVPAVLTGPVLGLPIALVLPFSRPRVRDVLLAFPVAAGLLPLATGVTAATLWVMPANPIFDAFLDAMTKLTEDGFGSIAVGVYPAICEELLYRGAIYALLVRAGSPALANVGQAAAFALAHGLAFRLPWTFLFGLITGALRIRTGSLVPSMVLHLVFNVGAASLGRWFPALSSGDAGGSWQVAPLLLLLPLILLYRREGARSTG
jgi:membrane protease YdiL (CAAX protease family)